MKDPFLLQGHNISIQQVLSQLNIRLHKFVLVIEGFLKEEQWLKAPIVGVLKRLEDTILEAGLWSDGHLHLLLDSERDAPGGTQPLSTPPIPFIFFCSHKTHELLLVCVQSGRCSLSRMLASQKRISNRHSCSTSSASSFVSSPLASLRWCSGSSCQLNQSRKSGRSSTSC